MVRNTKKYYVIEKKKKKQDGMHIYIQCWRLLKAIEKHHHQDNKIK